MRQFLEARCKLHEKRVCPHYAGPPACWLQLTSANGREQGDRRRVAPAQQRASGERYKRARIAVVACDAGFAATDRGSMRSRRHCLAADINMFRLLKT